MRSLLAGSLLAVVTATLLACSAGEAPAIDAPEEGTGESDVTSTEPEATDDTTADPAADATADAPAPGPAALAEPAATDSAGGPPPPPAPPAPAAPNPGTACEDDSVRETEGNNTATTANTIPPTSATYCGRLEAGDVDHVSFVMPQAIANFAYMPEAGFGAVRIEATAGGEAFNPDGAWPFAGGQPYVFKISAPGNKKPVDYRLRFTFSY